MMFRGEEIVRQARSMIGTPFKHQARKPGLDGGIDCVGLAVCIGRQLGLSIDDRTDYARETDGEMLQRSLDAHCVLVDRMDVGDLLQFNRGRSQWHVAIVSSVEDPMMMIHAQSRMGGGGQVREEVIGDSWMRRLVGIWRYREVT